MAVSSSTSKIHFVVLFFLLSSPLSSPTSTAAQEVLDEKSTTPVVVELKSTTKRLHRILVQLSSTLAQIIDNNEIAAAAVAATEADDDEDMKKTVESVREVLSLISTLESLLYNHDLSRARGGGGGGGGSGGLRSEIMLSTVSSLQSVLSSLDDESSFPLQFKVSDDFSSLLKRLVSLISSLESDITAIVTA